MLGTALHIFSGNGAISRSDSCANQEILIFFYRVVCQLEGTESHLQDFNSHGICLPLVELGILKKKSPTNGESCLLPASHSQDPTCERHVFWNVLGLYMPEIARFSKLELILY